MNGPLGKIDYLGLAFASAELLLKVDFEGNILNAVGASRSLLGQDDAEVVGRRWTDLFDPQEAVALELICERRAPGERQGPFKLRLAGGKNRWANLSVFSVPGMPPVMHCAIALLRDGEDAGCESRQNVGEVLTHAVLDGGWSGQPDDQLILFEVPDLEDRLGGLETAAADQVRRRLAAALRLIPGNLGPGSRLGRDRYAAFTSSACSTDRLVHHLGQALRQLVSPTATALPLGGGVGNLVAVRKALDSFIDAGAQAVQTTFENALKRELQQQAIVRARITRKDFSLVYQPVVTLTGANVHHFEALVRFSSGESPSGMLEIADQLDIICDLDLAVANAALESLERTTRTGSISINISGRSLTNPVFRSRFHRLVDQKATSVRKRLFLEVTEAQRLPDLAAANAAIQTYRAGGHLVSLDDFGAGAAALDYLRVLDVDIVKFDGGYLRNLGATTRDKLIVKHVVALCQEFGFETVAVRVENSDARDVALLLGVGLAQGWFYSRPLSRPAWNGAAIASSAAPAETIEAAMSRSRRAAHSGSIRGSRQ